MTTEPNNHLDGGGIAFTGLHGDNVSMAMRPKVTPRAFSFFFFFFGTLTSSFCINININTKKTKVVIDKNGVKKTNRKKEPKEPEGPPAPPENK